MSGWVDGTFTRVHDWTDDEAAGTNILSTRMDDEDDNFETGINSCLHKGGQNTPTADLPMGTKKHTGVGDATARTSYASAGQVQDGKFRYGGATGGSLNAYTISLTPPLTGYITGQEFSFKANRTNSGATTLNIDSLGAKAVWSDGAACSGDEIVINRVYKVIYDGTRFHLISGGGGGASSLGGAKVSLSSPMGIPYISWTTVTFRTELYDDGGLYYPSTTAGNNYFDIPATGRYRITAHLNFASQIPQEFGDYIAYSEVVRNGFGLSASRSICNISSTYTANPYFLSPQLSVVWEGELTKNDYVGIRVFQINGLGDQATMSASNDATWMAIERIY